MECKKTNKSHAAFTKVFEETYTYVSKFCKFKEINAVTAIAEKLAKCPSYTKEEKVQILNLCPADITEAKKLIPSLEGKPE